MILGARLDPVPSVGAALAFPEPRGALQVVHQEIDRLDSLPPMARGRGGDDEDRPGTVDGEDDPDGDDAL